MLILCQNQKKINKSEGLTLFKNSILVFTEVYHFKRGFCCKNECKHCPCNFEKSL